MKDQDKRQTRRRPKRDVAGEKIRKLLSKKADIEKEILDTLWRRHETIHQELKHHINKYESRD